MDLFGRVLSYKMKNLKKNFIKNGMVYPCSKNIEKTSMVPPLENRKKFEIIDFRGGDHTIISSVSN